jgi:hypothetical protein
VPSGGGDLITTGDAYLRHDAQSTNEGANPRLRVGIRPLSRAVVQFDENEINDQVQSGFTQALLVLTIASNHNTWGQTDDHAVSAYPLRETFVEGDGIQGLMPPDRVQRGSGPGATWHSPNDPEVADRKPGTKKRHNVVTNVVKWNGGKYGPATADPVVHVNQMDGTVTFDVTADVIDGTTGWLLKIDDERDPDRPLPLGNEPFVGVVEYHSVQGAQEAGDMDLAPRLRFS